MAIEVVGPTAPSVIVGASLQLEARALNARGEIVPDAPLEWHTLDTGLVGVTLDPISGLVTGVTPGTWRVQARVETLATPPITITVTAPSASLGQPRVALSFRRAA